MINTKHDLKKATSILLIAILTIPALRSFVIFSDFQLNRVAIAEALCENIETDDNCKGTCHLVKEIKKENPNKKESPFTYSDNLKIELLFFESSNSIDFNLNSFKASNDVLTYQDFDAHIEDVFHPPKSSVHC